MENDMIWLVVDNPPLCKIWVNWDDEIPNLNGKIIQSCSRKTTNQCIFLQFQSDYLWTKPNWTGFHTTWGCANWVSRSQWANYCRCKGQGHQEAAEPRAHAVFNHGSSVLVTWNYLELHMYSSALTLFLHVFTRDWHRLTSVERQEIYFAWHRDWIETQLPSVIALFTCENQGHWHLIHPNLRAFHVIPVE